MILYDGNKNQFETASEIARGGEGTIYRLRGLDNYCVKIYHQSPAALKIQKLKILTHYGTTLNSFGAFPISFAYKDAIKSNIVGIFLPFIGGHEIYELYGPSSRLQLFPKVKYNFLVHVALNIAHAFQEIHNAGFIVGDINEQNIKVLNDGTVRFIDTDSFQYVSNDAVYRCNVGTPLWTPPELHGRDLSTVVRNQNHDHFGLAQIIFLILFCGRHPFAGRPRGNRHLLPEDAIKEYAFAFAPANQNIPLLPPPASIKAESFDIQIYHAFCRAFLKGSESNNRPRSSDWISHLTDLKNSLISCINYAEHMHWKGSPSCPWCSLKKETGIDLFPRHSSVGNIMTDNPQRDNQYIQRLQNLRPTQFPLPEQTSFSDLIAQPLPAQPTGMWVDIQKFFNMSSWKKSWLEPHIQQFKKTLNTSENAYSESINAHKEAVVKYNKKFNELILELRPVIQQLLNPESIRKELHEHALRNRRTHELSIYLSKCKIRNANIQDIGYGRKATLASYGVETAADVTYKNISGISGFGYHLTQQMLNWRKKVEASFVFNPNAPTSQSFNQEVQRLINERITSLKNKIAEIEGKLKNNEKSTMDIIRSEASKALQASRSIAQMNKNISYFVSCS